MACPVPLSRDPVIDLEREGDAAVVERLVDAAFGPGRFAKTAERLREGASPLPGLAFVAREDGEVVGTVRLWPVRIGETPCAFLGPIAVDAERRREGLGAALTEAALAAARARGLRAVVLVGDPPYFARFGFRRAEGVSAPGPVDPARLMLTSFAPEPPRGPLRRG